MHCCLLGAVLLLACEIVDSASMNDDLILELKGWKCVSNDG